MEPYGWSGSEDRMTYTDLGLVTAFALGLLFGMVLMMAIDRLKEDE